MHKLLATAATVLALGSAPALAQPTDILNASYDIARELFEAENAAYAASGATVTINQSHAGSSTQARAVLEGLPADVVTLNQVTDIAKLVEGGFVAADWATQFPNKASPFYSFPSFLVRAGNPKDIQDWGDLAEDGVQVIFPNPKTSGNGRYTYLAARAWAVEEYAGDEARIEEFLTKLFNNVPVFETGGRAATTAFTERQLGDVLITFEAETLAVANQLGTDKYQPVTDFLFTPAGQEVAAANFHRPNDETVAAAHAETFPEIRLVTAEDAFGGWDAIAAEHFADGGLLDKVFLNP